MSTPILNYDANMGAWDENTPIQVSLKDLKMTGGGNGHVEPGRYKHKVLKSGWRKSAAGDVYGVLETEVVEGGADEACKGVPISIWIREPGQYFENDKRDMPSRGQWEFSQLTASVLSELMTPTQYEEQAKKEAFNVKNIGWFAGKSFFSTLRDATGDFEGTSEKDRFILKPEYIEKPGPDKVVAQRVAARRGRQARNAGQSATGGVAGVGDLPDPPVLGGTISGGAAQQAANGAVASGMAQSSNNDLDTVLGIG